MVGESLLQVFRGGFLGHFWQRLENFVLGEVDVLQRVLEQLVEGFHGVRFTKRH
jgi:hypothetical protein